jgi:hypothetical protein
MSLPVPSNTVTPAEVLDHLLVGLLDLEEGRAGARGIHRLQSSFDRDQLVAVEELEAVELGVPDVPMEVRITMRALGGHFFIAIDQAEIGELAKRGLGCDRRLLRVEARSGRNRWRGRQRRGRRRRSLRSRLRSRPVRRRVVCLLRATGNEGRGRHEQDQPHRESPLLSDLGGPAIDTPSHSHRSTSAAVMAQCPLPPRLAAIEPWRTLRLGSSPQGRSRDDRGAVVEEGVQRHGGEAGGRVAGLGSGRTALRNRGY